MTAKAVAMALPIPEEAPVIRADLPCRSFCPCPTMLFNQPATLSGFASGTSGEGLCGISAPGGPRNSHKSMLAGESTLYETYLHEQFQLITLCVHSLP